MPEFGLNCIFHLNNRRNLFYTLKPFILGIASAFGLFQQAPQTTVPIL